MPPPGMRATVLLACALAALGDCSARPAEDCVRPSPAARRLLIEASDLGPQARTLLPNLESDPFVYFRFINRPWSRATCAALGAIDDLASPEELAEIVHDAAAQLGTGHAWVPEDEGGRALRARKLTWLERAEPDTRALAKQITGDLLEAWDAFRDPGVRR